MTEKMKKLLCSILTGALILCLFPGNVYASEMAPSKMEITIQNDKDTGKPELKWKSVKGAYQYRVLRSKSIDGTYYKIGTISKSKYIDKSAKNSVTYFYKVKAMPARGEGWKPILSNTQTGTAKLARPVIKTKNIPSSGKIQISWNKVAGAKRYHVYRSFSEGGEYKFMGSTKKNYMVHKSAAAGKRYYYKVKAVPKDGMKRASAFSKWKSRVCDLGQPKISVDLNANGKPKLTWKQKKNAEAYVVFRALKENGNYRRIAKVKNLSFVDKNAAFGNIYYYKVKAVDQKEPAAASALSKAKSIRTINLNKKLIALTFDDGPGPYTKDIVDCLRRNKGRATFFVLGQYAKSYPSTIKAIYKDGNEIGNHSYNHPDLSGLSGAQIRAQINKTDRIVKNIVGEKPKTIRPPYGAIDDTVKKNVGKPMILWNIDTLDWEHKNANTTVSVVLNQAEDGDIVLMHDIHEPTRDAALELIPKLMKRGFELVTISELAKYRGNGMAKGVRYYNF